MIAKHKFLINTIIITIIYVIIMLLTYFSGVGNAFAMETSKEKAIQFYEGQIVSYQDLTEKIQNTYSLSNVEISTNINYPQKQLSSTDLTDVEKDITVYGLYTYANEIEINQSISFKIDFTYLEKNSIKKSDTCIITVKYNNEPTASASNRYFTLTDVQKGIVTENELCASVLAYDKEDGKITFTDTLQAIDETRQFKKDENNLPVVFTKIRIKEFDSFNFAYPGEYQITYEITDKYYKTSYISTTVTISDSFKSEIRFIKESYYPLLINNFYKDNQGNYKAVKYHGIICYCDKNGNPYTNENNVTGVYPVDAGPKIQKYLKADGTYKIKPLSKWLTDSKCIKSIKSSFVNKKDANDEWDSVNEIWIFTSDEIKKIKNDINTEIQDENSPDNIIIKGFHKTFYKDWYETGHCIAFSNKTNTSAMVDNGAYFLQYLSIENGTIVGLKKNVAIDKNYFIFPQENADGKITSIKKDAFTNNENIEILIIPKTITKIEDNAFKNWTNLKTVYVLNNKNSVNISNTAFSSNINIKYINK